MIDKQYFPLKLAVAAFAVILRALICPSPVWAATFTVSTTSDDGPGSLRQVITDANNTPGKDTIEFVIPGSGSGNLIASAGNGAADRVLSPPS